MSSEELSGAKMRGTAGLCRKGPTLVKRPGIWLDSNQSSLMGICPSKVVFKV